LQATWTEYPLRYFPTTVKYSYEDADKWVDYKVKKGHAGLSSDDLRKEGLELDNPKHRHRIREAEKAKLQKRTDALEETVEENKRQRQKAQQETRTAAEARRRNEQEESSKQKGPRDPQAAHQQQQDDEQGKSLEGLLIFTKKKYILIMLNNVKYCTAKLLHIFHLKNVSVILLCFFFNFGAV
jgi:hypothetical protein